MPLSGMGLWDAEITAPISTFSTEVRYATPGVGIIPASITSNPPADMPADSAAARKSPETRVSRPTSARRRPSNSLLSPSSPSTRTAASPKSNASCAVKALFANPRTPSVPNIRGMSLKSSLSQVILPCTIVLNGFTIQQNSRQHVAIPAYCSMRCHANRSMRRREISAISSFLRSHFHPPIPTGWVIMGPKDPLSITVMGLCLGWLVWKQTSPDWQRDKSRRQSGLMMQYHRVISEVATKNSYCSGVRNGIRGTR